MNKIRLRESDKKVLLKLGDLRRSTPRELGEILDYDKHYIYERLRALKDQGKLVKKPSKGMYELTEKGKEHIKKEDNSLRETKKELQKLGVLGGGVGPGEEGEEERLLKIWVNENKAKNELKELKEEINLEDYELLVKIEKELNKASITDKFKEKLKI